jgi:hypothetical protein
MIVDMLMAELVVNRSCHDRLPESATVATAVRIQKKQTKRPEAGILLGS